MYAYIHTYKRRRYNVKFYCKNRIFKKKRTDNVFALFFAPTWFFETIISPVYERFIFSTILYTQQYGM